MDLRNAPLRLLLIEDSPSDAILLQAALRDSALRSASVVHETTLNSGLNRLGQATFDAVLVDLSLPDSSGIDTLIRVTDGAGPAAVVAITGAHDRKLAEEAVRLGAQDVLNKDEYNPSEIGHAVDYAIQRQRRAQAHDDAHAKELAERALFVSHISHSLRSPLSVVHGFASLLLDGNGGPLSADQKDFLGVLMRNVDQLTTMINGMTEMARVERGGLSVNCRPTELRALLSDTITSYRPLAEDRQIDLSLVCGELPAVHADGDRTREILANLVDNALRFTPNGGRITIEAANLSGMMQITVRDTGRGIAPEDQERIFDQFFQSEHSDEAGHLGLGLGLFVSRELIRKQGGAISVESTVGRGTAMSFTLPVMGIQSASEAVA
jgi:signal transduction histidine kinase